MKVRVLGCSGAIAKDCRTTAFLLGDRILIDAGTGVGDLTLEEMRTIDHVFLTHSHLDHVAALPLMLDAVGAQRAAPVTVHALPETIAALGAHVFNDTIWPDFSRLPTQDAPFVRYAPLAAGQQLEIAGIPIEVLPANHTVPAVGYAARGARGWWAFSGDTGPNPALWQRLNAMDLAMLVIETAFSSRESQLAQRSLHLSPPMLVSELLQWRPKTACPVYITHTKPLETDRILAEVRNLDALPGQARMPHDIFWLQAGQEFAI
ncbi:MAG: 3',5'-cyclic-nucleotide phosphodiesterase [Acidovorax sp.]|nr:3',5'-cyclic-nucleotide phosphodiesterase [Acidovorax sp.]